LQPESRRLCTPRFVIGIFLVIMGVALTLAELGIMPVYDVGRFWPAVVILIGLSMFGRGGRNSWFGGLTLIIIGSWLLLNTLGFVTLDPWEFIGPLILVLVGVRIMFRRSRRTAPVYGAPTTTGFGDGSEHSDQFALWSGSRRRWAHTVFRSADATSLMGGCVLDLRDALMGTEGTASIEVFALMGGVHIFVPPTWTVISQVTAILGGVDDKTHPIPSNPPQQLFLRGIAIMGGVEINN